MVYLILKFWDVFLNTVPNDFIDKEEKYMLERIYKLTGIETVLYS